MLIFVATAFFVIPAWSPNTTQPYPNRRRWISKRKRVFPHPQWQLQQSGAFFSRRGCRLSIWRRVPVAGRRSALFERYRLPRWNAPTGDESPVGLGSAAQTRAVHDPNLAVQAYGLPLGADRERRRVRKASLGLDTVKTVRSLG
jgi:hypothetical protein